MRALPNMTIVYPGDAAEMRAVLPAAVGCEGPVYLRLYREPTPVFSEAWALFEIGKARIIREGRDVTLIGTGPHAAYALEAAELLKVDGVSAEVLAVPTIQSLDAETIVSSAVKTGRVVTAEDHSVNGGLGSAVEEVLGEYHPTPMRRVGARQFGESGKYDELNVKLGIDAAGIVRAAKEVVTSG